MGRRGKGGRGALGGAASLSNKKRNTFLSSPVPGSGFVSTHASVFDTSQTAQNLCGESQEQTLGPYFLASRGVLGEGSGKGSICSWVVNVRYRNPREPGSFSRLSTSIDHGTAAY